jgi:phenylacetate-coenzyme A ligase PaaK-like adenylate-forming protein
MTLVQDGPAAMALARERFIGGMPGHFERLGFNADQLLALQTERLRRLLETAAERSPYHARRLAGIDLSSVTPGDLRPLPVMTKDDMMAHYDDVVTDRRITKAGVEAQLASAGEDPRLFLDEYLVLTSGGSSGVRGVFAWTMEAAVEFFSCVLRSGLQQVAAMMGWPPPTPLPIVLGAAPTGIHATRALLPLAEGAVVRPAYAPATLPFQELVARVNAAQPVLLAGYTSTIARLADARSEGRLRVAPLMVVVTSEQLTPELAARITRGFGAPPANSFASTEGLIGSAPPGSEVFDFASDFAIVEFVDADDRPVQRGEPADHVLVTNLANIAQPLIRYRLDDRMVEAEPSDGHGHQRAALQGRTDSYLDFEGVAVHPLTLRSALLRHPEILEYQVTCNAHSVRVSVVPAGPVDLAAVQRDIAAALSSAGVACVDVSARLVDSVVRDPATGKARRFIAE